MQESELLAAGYVPVCPLAEVGQPMPKRVEIEGRGVLICREGDDVYAVDELCPHENKSMKFGVVFGGVITCPHHQYRFQLDTGACRKRCAPLQTFEVELFQDQVWVRV